MHRKINKFPNEAVCSFIILYRDRRNAMDRTLTEQRILKQLGIPDFRHMTKAKVVKFASMLPKMDPEVAKKALEQFPEFTKSANEIIGYYKDTIDKAVDSNRESVKLNYEICNNIIESLREQLEDETLTFEQRMIIDEKMIGVAKLAKDIDKENKDFLAKVLTIGGIVAVAALSVATSILGSRSEINNNNLDSDDTIDVEYKDADDE